MKFTLKLLASMTLVGGMIWLMTGCSALSTKGNCFGPPAPDAMAAHQAFTAKLSQP